MMAKGKHTNVRTYVRDRPYIPSTTLLCEGIHVNIKRQAIAHELETCKEILY